MSALQLARFLHGMTAHETDVRLDDAALRTTLGHAALRVPRALPPDARIAAARTRWHTGCIPRRVNRPTS
ncbi:hypothetical protein L3V59_19570 [Burkholderia aenigmatica]|uniref:hypothetical protein n=1 Tax=Burkholderia aenigmatica TaxID=2015348 RepID=UPI001F159A6C|nr:hypothetical protein [Burkholderia aenigmatica]UKD15160.1 hypothetical protein L3V59_19570 [Burkholderia aenigmatica]